MTNTRKLTLVAVLSALSFILMFYQFSFLIDFFNIDLSIIDILLYFVVLFFLIVEPHPKLTIISYTAQFQSKIRKPHKKKQVPVKA